MTTTELTDVVAAYVKAANAQDVNGVSACFADDAVVRDEGRDRSGAEAIRDWAEEVSQKYRPVVEPRSVYAENGRTVMIGRVSGAFPGSPLDLRYQFTITGQKISRLEIAP
jgi:hypothetical protein